MQARCCESLGVWPIAHWQAWSASRPVQVQRYAAPRRALQPIVARHITCTLAPIWLTLPGSSTECGQQRAVPCLLPHQQRLAPHTGQRLQPAAQGRSGRFRNFYALQWTPGLLLPHKRRCETLRAGCREETGLQRAGRPIRLRERARERQPLWGGGRGEWVVHGWGPCPPLTALWFGCDQVRPDSDSKAGTRPGRASLPWSAPLGGDVACAEDQLASSAR